MTPYQIAPIAESFFNYLDTIHLLKGDILFHQQDASDNLFYLIEGELEVYLELNENQRKRISIINSGNVVGEIGFYLETPRTATVIANEDCILKRLTMATLKIMERDNPALITQYHYSTAKILCERLTRMNRQITLLLK